MFTLNAEPSSTQLAQHLVLKATDQDANAASGYLLPSLMRVPEAVSRQIQWPPIRAVKPVLLTQHQPTPEPPRSGRQRRTVGGEPSIASKDIITIRNRSLLGNEPSVHRQIHQSKVKGGLCVDVITTSTSFVPSLCGWTPKVYSFRSGALHLQPEPRPGLSHIARYTLNQGVRKLRQE